MTNCWKSIVFNITYYVSIGYVQHGGKSHDYVGAKVIFLNKWFKPQFFVSYFHYYLKIISFVHNTFQAIFS
jgi:hypothetical protein